MDVIVATFGERSWIDLAYERAIPSAKEQAPVIHVHGETLAAARNTGLAQAESEWVCFLDADDSLAPGYVEAMEHAHDDLRTPAVQYPGRPAELIPPVDLRRLNYLVIGTAVRRQMALDVGGFREWPLYEDWCFFQRCWKAGAVIEQVPDAVYCVHGGARNEPPRTEKRRWLNAIRRANFPELYDRAA